MKASPILLLMVVACLAVTSCQKKVKGDEVTPPGAPSPVELRFKGVYQKLSDLHFDSTYYITASYTPPLMPIKFSTLKYYISNIQFVNDDGDTIKIPDTYFLIDHSKPELTKAAFTVPAGDYYAMSFMIGVDGARSANGPRTGALDPALGMFWNSDDGYVNAMLEGTAPLSSDPNDKFSFRIGGYKAPNNTLSIRDFKLGGNVMITPNKKTVINFTTDVIQWLNGPNAVPFASTPFINAPGPDAQKISQNYYKMFDFVSVKYE